jgi:hypothetical protein
VACSSVKIASVFFKICPAFLHLKCRSLQSCALHMRSSLRTRQTNYGDERCTAINERDYCALLCARLPAESIVGGVWFEKPSGGLRTACCNMPTPSIPRINCICVFRMTQRTTAIALNNSNWMVVAMETLCDYCEAGTEGCVLLKGSSTWKDSAMAEAISRLPFSAETPFPS